MNCLSIISWEALTAIAALVTPITIILAARQIRISRQQVQFASITRCISEFRSMEGLHREATSAVVARYVDLVNEEIFYMQHKYLPDEICLEWIDGIIDFLPVYHTSGDLLNPGNCLLQLEKRPEIYLRGYDRIKSTFTVSGQYKWSAIYNEDAQHYFERRIERRKAAIEIFKNSRAYKF